MEPSNSYTTQSIADFWGVLTESKRIIHAHSRHFLALSVLFLLPLSFSLTVFRTLLHTFTSPTSNHIQSLLRLSNHKYNQSYYSSKSNIVTLHPSLNYPHHRTLVFAFFFASFIVLFSILGFVSISSSVHHGFYGRPVRIYSAFASVLRSFFPVLITVFCGVGIVVVCLVLFGGVAYFGINFVGYGLDFDGIVWIGVVGLFGFVLGYVFVNSVLFGVIVVVESKWGFEPLFRSKDLVVGMRWVALSLIVFFGFFEVVLLWIGMVSGSEMGGSMNGWNAWWFAAKIVATTAVLTVVLLHGIAATTVLYMYCKALHGELAGEIAHEFAADFVSLPFDEKKIPHVVCYVY